MARQEVNIELRADGSKAVREFGKVSKASRDFVVNVKKIGNMFGEIGGNIAGLFQNVLKGGVFGIMQSVVSIGVDAFRKWRDSEKAAAEELDRMKESAKEAIKAEEQVFKTIADSCKSSISNIDSLLAKRKEEIDTVKNLAKAELELQKQRAVQKGDAKAVAAIDKRMSALDDKAANDKADAEAKASEDKIKEAEKARLQVVSRRLRALNALRSRQTEAARMESEVEDRAKKNAHDYDAYDIQLKGGRLAPGAYREETYARIRESEMSRLHESKEWKKLTELIKASKGRVEVADKAIVAADASVAEEKRKAAIQGKKATTAKIKEKVAEVKSEIDAAKAAAAERDRLDRELHQKRMDDLKAEMAAQKEAASPLRATVAAAQSEFERAFAMYRSPEQAASQIAEERDRASDLKQLHKDASRYGGKWRIDELAGLMAAGDSAGVQSRLEDWRKSKSFTPEVEAMVRASAAEQTKTTAEDELRKLNDKTGELAQKIETLAQSRDGKLDGIERNTNQLANKLDELLTVKG